MKSIRHVIYLIGNCINVYCKNDVNYIYDGNEDGSDSGCDDEEDLHAPSYHKT